MRAELSFVAYLICYSNGLYVGLGAVSGAFSGLIAYGVAHINNPTIAPWRILLLIEGGPTVVLAVLVLWLLPSRPQLTKQLNEDERALAIARLKSQHLQEGHTGFDWSGTRRAASDWKIYVMGVCYMGLNLTLASIGGFLPTIIKSLGYSNARAQLFSVPASQFPYTR